MKISYSMLMWTIERSWEKGGQYVVKRSLDIQHAWDSVALWNLKSECYIEKKWIKLSKMFRIDDWQQQII